MREFAEHSPLLLCLTTVFFGALASLVPVSPVEPVLVAIAAVAPTWLLLPLVILATVSHMSTKTLVFIGARKIEAVLNGRNRERFDRARNRMTGRNDLQRSTLFVSSVTGLPPFYITTTLCGALKMPLRDFLLVATTGRTIRFAALIFVPQLFQAKALHAQTSPTPPAITVVGSGPDTYVLLSGMVGGVAGLRAIGSRLAAKGNRVISIDPYQLSIGATAVSFDAIARRVDAELEARDVSCAKVVGHAHGGGVALRLAANAPERVCQLFLIDVGAMAANRSSVFGSSIRLVPLILHLPKGRTFVRNRFERGVRATCARMEWLTDSTKREYVNPILDRITEVVGLAGRLNDAAEPEPRSAVISRIHVPVTLLLGALHTAAGPGEAEIKALDVLGDQLRIETIAGAGHFPHEESPDAVVRLLAPRIVAIANPGGAR